MNSIDADALESAIQVAMQAHQGQRDKSGQPYILHVLRVMLGVQGPLAQQAGVLHDTVEDTTTSFEDLLQAGVSPEAVEAVRLLTHDDSMGYAEYVCRLKGNSIARSVKLSDLNDNYRLDRVAYRAEHAEKDAARIQKYILTRQFLCDEIDEANYRNRMTGFES